MQPRLRLGALNKKNNNYQIRNKMELREYQIELSNKGCQILTALKIVYLIMEVRTGKTLTSLKTADLYGAKKVLFITKLKAISSIQKDYDLLSPSFEIQIINKESLHKITDTDFDLLIVDENHAVSSSFPKPNNATKQIKARFGNLPHIYLSGTPAIESGSQWFHSFWISNNSPFKNHKNFYSWAKEFTTPAIKHFGALKVNDYSKAIDEKIMPIIEPYLIRFTQEQAGFKTEITEKVIYYDTPEHIKKIVSKLLSDLVAKGKSGEVILGDSAAKLMSKVHQLEGGTVIFENRNSMVLDTGKAKLIKERFKGKKIAMFYYFKKELELLKSVFGDTLTDNLDEFNSTDKHIALQQISASEGISLKAADVLVYYSAGYSGRQYVQGRDRLSVIDRERNEVYFVLNKGGLTEKIYKTIKTKKRYNEKLFRTDYKGIISPDIN